MTWHRDGCFIKHPVRGEIKVYVKGNCPYLDENMGMTLMREVEENQKKKAACLRTLTSGESDLSVFPLKFLEKIFTEVPAKELVNLGSISKEYDTEQLPWNRRCRRRIAGAKGVVLHLFAGPDQGFWRKRMPPLICCLFYYLYCDGPVAGGGATSVTKESQPHCPMAVAVASGVGPPPFARRNHLRASSFVAASVSLMQWQDLAATSHLIAAQPEETQKATSLYVTGASLVRTQLKYVKDYTDKCRFCSADDDINHRVVQCPATAYVRADYAEMISQLEQHHECAVYLPVITQDPFFEFNTCYNALRPAPSPDEHVLALMRAEIAQGLLPIVFTDGTCNRPKHACYRRAAYAAVYRPRVTNESKANQIAAFLAEDNIPPSFQVVFVAEAKGAQTIPRAELQAVLELIKLHMPMEIHTDSQYVLDAWDILSTTQHITAYHRNPNYDLWKELSTYIPQSQVTLHKVKAHDLANHKQQQTMQPEWWPELGNEAADRSAKQALKHFEQTTPLHENFTDHLQEVERLQQQYAYLADLQCARAQIWLGQTAQDTESGRIRSWDLQINLLKTWRPPGTWTFQIQGLNLDKLQDYLWGTQYGYELLRFLEQLTWPAAEVDPMKAGVTWYELMISYKMYMQKGVVVNVGTSGMGLKPRRLDMNDQRKFRNLTSDYTESCC